MMQLFRWFLITRWKYKKWVKDGKVNTSGYYLYNCHNGNIYGCRKHPVIYNDMCRIVRGGK